jgi:adenylate kinase
VGLDKEKYLAEALRLVRERGNEIQVVTVGQRMIQNYDGDISEKTILNLPKAALDTLRRCTWRELLREAENGTEGEIFVINSHSVFRWHHGLFPAIDLDLLLEFGPQYVVTLIDDADNIKRRLIERGTDFFELWELLAWREEEIWVTKLLAESVARLGPGGFGRFYVLPIAQGPLLLSRLLTEPETPRVYMSFPKTGLRVQEQELVDNFKQEVSERFISFDPLAMEERSILTAAQSLTAELSEEFASVSRSTDELAERLGNRHLRWRPAWDEWSPLSLTELIHDNVALPGRQIVSVFEAIDSQIIARDFLLIDQSDFIVLYIRTDSDGQPLISAGSQSEMVYAYSHGKEVYVVCAGGRRALSPWVSQFSEVFETLPEALEYLSRKLEDQP